MPEKTQAEKSADQILDELFSTLGTAPPAAEPPPPGDVVGGPVDPATSSVKPGDNSRLF